MTKPRRRTAKTRRVATPTLLALLAVIGAIWLYQNGYVARLLERIQPSQTALAPELEDSSSVDPPLASQPVVPQPDAPDVDAPPPDERIETTHLYGLRGPWYQVYFTKPTYPERAADRTGGLDETIAADIDNARQRVDLATFDLDAPRIGDALLRAHARGVQVRVAYDGVNLESEEVAVLVGQLEAAGIAVFRDDRDPFMHNKFIVIDARTVWTGSANLTVNDIFRNNNNMLRINDPVLAANFIAKMDDLMAGGGGPGGASTTLNPAISIGGVAVVNLFTPDDDATDAIIERLNRAQHSIDVLAFTFTADPMADAVIAARERGVAVRVVLETRNVAGTGSELQQFQNAGIDVHTDGNCYIMHNKVMVIDGATVITGSFNFTASAQAQNDENMLIIDDTGFAARYTEEVERVYQQALNPPRCR